MSIIGNAMGASLGIKLINGKIKPKFEKSAVIVICIMVLLLLGAIIGFIYTCFFSFEFELFLFSLLTIPSIIYLLLISPYTQNSNNYYIEFQNENELTNFKLFYKKKLVNINYKITNDGKLAFSDDSSKLSCIGYSNGDKISDFTKHRIINYFTRWLSDNDLLSDDVTTTFE